MKDVNTYMLPKNYKIENGKYVLRNEVEMIEENARIKLEEDKDFQDRLLRVMGLTKIDLSKLKDICAKSI